MKAPLLLAVVFYLLFSTVTHSYQIEFSDKVVGWYRMEVATQVLPTGGPGGTATQQVAGDGLFRFWRQGLPNQYSVKNDSAHLPHPTIPLTEPYQFGSPANPRSFQSSGDPDFPYEFTNGEPGKVTTKERLGVAVGKMPGNLEYSGISGISLNVGGSIKVVHEQGDPGPGNHVTLRVRGLAKLLTHVQSAADANANATATAVLIINGHRIEANSSNGSAGRVSVSFEGMTPTVETGLPTGSLATTSSSFAEHIPDMPIGSEIPFELIVDLRVSNTDPFGLFAGTVAAAVAQLTEHACTITAE